MSGRFLCWACLRFLGVTRVEAETKVRPCQRCGVPACVAAVHYVTAADLPDTNAPTDGEAGGRLYVLVEGRK